MLSGEDEVILMSRGVHAYVHLDEQINLEMPIAFSAKIVLLLEIKVFI